MMNKTRRASVYLALCAAMLCLASGAAHAQRLKYDSQAEVFGAATTSPTAGKQILRALLARCAVAGPDAQAAGERAVRAWEKRHQLYFEENVRVKEEYFKMLSGPQVTPAQRQALRKMHEVTLPKMVESQVAALAAPIDDAAGQPAKASVCLAYAASVDDGQWELKKNDPVVAKFLDDRLEARAKTMKLILGQPAGAPSR
jgi:hypothetical protein